MYTKFIRRFSEGFPKVFRRFSEGFSGSFIQIKWVRRVFEGFHVYLAYLKVFQRFSYR